MGGCPDRFWRQTPRLIRSFIRGRSEAERQRHRLAKAQAWHTAALYRTRDFPDLADFLGDPVEPQSDDDMTFNLAAFAAATSTGE